MSSIVFNKLKGAFEGLGIKVKGEYPIYEFEYRHVSMLLTINDEDQRLCIVSFIVDVGDVKMDERILWTAVNIVEDFYEGYSGFWKDDGLPQFFSPVYRMKNVKEVSEEMLLSWLEEFHKAYLFLESNIHILCDSTLMGQAKDGVARSSVMGKEDLEAMIIKDFIANRGLICVDASDIKKIREESDFLDGCKKECCVKDIRKNLQSAIDEIRQAHGEAILVHLAVKILFNRESEMMKGEVSALGEVFAQLGNVEIVWGFGKIDDKSHQGKIAICVLGGFKDIEYEHLQETE